MRSATAGLLAACVLTVGAHGLQPRAPGCDAIGKIQFICDIQSPEDFATVPDSAWMLVSGNRPGQGAIRALHTRDRKIVQIFPAPTVRAQADAQAFPGCPGPIDLNEPAEKKAFSVHGMYLKAGTGSTHRLFVVHHGARESIEAFDVDGKASPPSLTWVGCVVGPPNASFNSMVALPDGGVAVTNTPRPAAGQKAPENPIGAVWEWHSATGWHAAPGTEAGRINGLEISRDGKFYFVAAWGDTAFIRVGRGSATPQRDVLKMPFRIDNLRLQADGSLLAAGHGGTALCSCPTETWHVGRIDPRGAMSVTELVKEPYVAGFGASTVAMQVGKEIWIGTNRGDRIGYYATP